MKNKLYLLLLIFSLNGIAQNVIPNPGFEQYSICPDNWSQISRSTFWDSYRETPDYYNMCSPSSSFAPPNCILGAQYPHSGNAYAGFYTFHFQFQNYREFIGIQLLSNLVIGQKYFISFYVNLSGNINVEATIASNKMGVKFSTFHYSYLNPVPINNTAHFYSNDIITDTVKWTKISGSFIADSAYSYIMIGNFFDDANTDTLNLAATNNNFAYYFFDDVCVSPDSLYCENWLGVNEQSVKKEDVTIYPNPCVNQLNVNIYNKPNVNTTISIIDITGKIIMQAKTTENEFVFNTEKIATGLYLVKVESEGAITLTKVTKE